MAGIERYLITDTIRGAGANRFTDSRKCWTAANVLYRSIYKSIGLELEPGDITITCTKNEFEAGYDYALGIDVVLKTLAGQSITLQEKFLFTTFNTVTVEYWQDWRTQERGDWFNMKCQHYFTGYDYEKRGSFDNWILLNWPQVQIATAQNRITWGERPNQHDNARASFRYAKFSLFPKDTVISKYVPTIEHSHITTFF